MDFRKILDQLNIFKQSRRYGTSLWQFPQFLFLVMGIIIIAFITTTYAIGNLFIDEPEIVALIVLVISVFLLIITYTAVRGFEKLADANRLKSEFVSIVSHQIRAPLSNLRWAIELLMSGRLGPIEAEQLDYFKILKENMGRMKELVNDLLVVSRIEQGTLSRIETKIDLPDLARSVISGFTIFAKASNIEINLETDPNLPQLKIDSSQMKLIVENLIDNAIRYSKAKGKVYIKINRQNGKIFFEIKDDGVGIPDKDQRFIFEKFFRSSNALKYQTQGSGLGLFIIKSIVEKEGGKIWFESEEDKGSTFFFTLPIK